MGYCIPACAKQESQKEDRKGQKMLFNIGKRADANSTLSIITFKVLGLNLPIKTESLSKWVF